MKTLSKVDYRSIFLIEKQFSASVWRFASFDLSNEPGGIQQRVLEFFFHQLSDSDFRVRAAAGLHLSEMVPYLDFHYRCQKLGASSPLSSIRETILLEVVDATLIPNLSHIVEQLLHRLNNTNDSNMIKGCYYCFLELTKRFSSLSSCVQADPLISIGAIDINPIAKYLPDVVLLAIQRLHSEPWLILEFETHIHIIQVCLFVFKFYWIFLLFSRQSDICTLDQLLINIGSQY